MTANALLKRRPFLSLVALVAILDPPRDEAIEAVKVAHKAGIQVKMITGEFDRVGGLTGCFDLGFVSGGVGGRAATKRIELLDAYG